MAAGEAAASSRDGNAPADRPGGLVELDARGRRLRAALGFLQIAPRAPELLLLHRWLDTWAGLGLIVVGVERQGLRFSLSHIGESEWRAQFSAHPMWASAGYGVAATPWLAVQRAAWAAIARQRLER
jgi:hypothetical protein